MLPIAFVAIAVTSVIGLCRPRVGRWRAGPALASLAGVFVLALFGLVEMSDAGMALGALFPALIGIASMMVMTACVAHLSSLDVLAAWVERRVGSSTLALFVVVFCGSFVTSSILNNDAAVVVNTTLVASLLRRRFARRAEVVEPFLLAVFLGAGVAPLAVSNPMNLAVAHLAHIDFLTYAKTMLPVSLVGASVTLAVLVIIYRRHLRGDAALSVPAVIKNSDARLGLLLVGFVLVSYVAMSLASMPSWPIALAGALVSLWLVRRNGASAFTALREGVAVEVLVVLPVVFVFAAGLCRGGLVDAFTPLLAHQGAFQVGAVSAIGSALMNNHTMALINMSVLLEGTGVGDREIFAALIGGDLGPRLLPFGSLAGLLWLDALARQGLSLPLRRFVIVGVCTGVPALAASLLALRVI